MGSTRTRGADSNSRPLMREGYGGKAVREDESDVEGHRMPMRATESFGGGAKGRAGIGGPKGREGYGGKAVREDEDDVEGHGLRATRGE